MATRPFLLFQSRDADDPMREHEVECFRRTLGLSPEGILVVDALARTPTPDELHGAAGVLMGGSGDHSCLDGHPWVARMVRWIREVLVPSGVPTFGSCFGFQVLVLALGGRMVRDPENRELGTLDLSPTPAAADDPLFGGLPNPFAAQLGHTDRAEGPPPGTVVLASSARCPVEAYRVVGRPVWATQFHPEIDETTFRERYLRYAAKYPAEGTPEGGRPEDAPFLSALRPSPEATRVLARFPAVSQGGAMGIAWPPAGAGRRVSPPSESPLEEERTFENPMSQETTTDQGRTPDIDPSAVSARAFALYVRGGKKPGRELADWLEAERQLREEALAPAVAAAPAVTPVSKPIATPASKPASTPTSQAMPKAAPAPAAAPPAAASTSPAAKPPATPTTKGKKNKRR